MGWISIKDETSAEKGSEGGTIIVDDEHASGARVTLEEATLYNSYAITCGLYGWMVHTRFFTDRTEAFAAIEAMKHDLARLLDRLPREADFDAWIETDAYRAFIDALHAFVDRYP